MNIEQATIYVYFLMIAMSLFTIFVVNRLQDSRIGRAWIALREDEVACQAMGIDKRKTKLMAFALGATWAGFAGVVFAAKTTFINPASFTIWESINILCVVVLGGMGSICGGYRRRFCLDSAARIPRVLSEYRMLAFGAVLVVMMVFRPGGIVETVRRTYQYKETTNFQGNGKGS
jgi:branched-chain amino acid transport system permease protein